MNRKIGIAKVFILVLLVVTFLTGCGGNDMQSENIVSPEDDLNNFSKIIGEENLDGFRLIIYYMNPFILTRMPLSVDNLIYGITAINEPPREKNDVNGLYEQKFVITGSQLEEHIDLFTQIGKIDLIPVEKESYINVRIYYMFESEKDGKIFDVALWGGYDENSMFVNGTEVKENAVFYEAILPFLPENYALDLKNYIAGIWPGVSE